ncbi:Bacteriophage (PhiC31) resistance gene pglY [Nocardiopsis sp. JB363]|nr:Bacteriophage (PhiC31) resistance gene pglY [Nocardiopsis sp. JB363]
MNIKESISTSDFVLKLAEATTPEGAEEALRDYVVTDKLLDNFDEALGLIRSALDGRTSKAAYLHGSFGSGKSHFMAVLYALLSGNAAARSRGDLDPVLTKHEWLATDGRKFLLVPYYMIGAKALEQRVLGGYVKHVKRLHPDAPTPQVYRTDALFDNIRSMRERMGDDTVINGLSATGTGAPVDGSVENDDDDDDWDEFVWTPERLDTALSAPEANEGDELDLLEPATPAELRARLVKDAGTNLLPGFARGAAEDEHGFISLDAGLSVIAEHAKSLGYDGLVLFLDELILWLATLIHDQKFVAREASKITNFVEGGDARRAIPIVSFIARQRDLRELVGEEVSGAAESSIQDTLNLASGRFDKITLEDRNLPQVAHARLLQPKEGKAALIDEAFAKTKRAGGPQVWSSLLGSDESTTGADEASFRLTYPFSPVFMDTLVHISSALQRSRTGLKLMGQLLADHRDDLHLGELVPVGDLYAVIAEGGDKPFTDSLKVVFDAADKLYRNKLRPYLLKTYDIDDDDVDRYLHHRADITDQGLADRCKAFVGDDRLVCTLLLSALAPSVPTLNDLTPRRLGALNHGSVASPIQGGDVGIIKNKIAEWAARFPEIKEADSSLNPVVRLELAGVDVDSVIKNAEVNDNPGNRMALAKRLLAEELGVERAEGRMGADDLRLVWRGSNRSAEVLFGNLADEDDLPDHDLQPQMEDQWRIIIDLPFDENNRVPADDVNRITTLREKQSQGKGERSRTVAWIPAHLSAQRWAGFRKLVVIDRALANEGRFANQYASHLNADDKERAKGLLQSQREALIKQVKGAFKQAYGLSDKKPGDVTDFDEHFHALPDVADLKVSIGQPMRDGIRHVAGKLLAHQFPAHPDLDPDGTGAAIKVSDTRTVFAHVRAAADAGDRRTEVPSKDRGVMRRVAGPLGLGQQKEAYFELSTRWADHFHAQARAEGATGDLSLTHLTDWTDRPERRGLEPFLANLVAASFAEMTDRVWVRGGTPLDPAPELAGIKPNDALRDQPRPGEEDWDRARERFEAVFGQKAPALRRGRMVNHFAKQITEGARSHQESAADLVRKLEEHSVFLGLDETGETGRLALARRSLDLLKELADAGKGTAGTSAAKKTIEALARFDLGPVNADRYGTSIKWAQRVAEALTRASWDTLELAQGQGVEGQELLESLRGVAREDQRTADLVEALSSTRREVTALIKRNQPLIQPPPPPVAPSPVGPEDVDLGRKSNNPPVSDTGHGNRPDVSSTGADTVRRSGTTRTTADQAAGKMAAELAALRESEPDATVEITWRVVQP